MTTPDERVGIPAERVGIPNEIECFDIGMTIRFRGITRRQGLLWQGPAGWAEWSPFLDYDGDELKPWLAAAVEAGQSGYPAPIRETVPVNCTVPAVAADRAYAITADSGCRTAKVKVAERGQTLADDLARVEAVRAAVGPNGAVRVDANGGWEHEEAVRALRELARFELEYAEQPVATVEGLARLRRDLVRRGIGVPIAADESIRRSGDPERVARLEAADVAVLKVQPLGGVRRCLELADSLGLPVVVSSALETSIGLAAGVALAAALPKLPYACGLNTRALLDDDVVPESLTAVEGEIRVRDVAPDPAALARCRPDPEVARMWRTRLERTAA